jgi:hydrogenase/urease accessory protein HupE
LGVLFCPGIAHAHLVTTGMGPVYDGIGHFVLTPEDWVPVVALALLAGLRGAEAGRGALFLLPVAWAAGGCLGFLAHAGPSFPIPALMFLIFGALVAADFRLPAKGVMGLAAGLGVVQGYLNGASLGMLEVTGAIATVFVVVALVAAAVVSLKQPWTRIIVRVMGSWIAASGLFMLGWFVRGHLN